MVTWQGMGCGCNIFTEDTSGGVMCGGIAAVYHSRVYMEGGAKGGGRAFVDVVGEVFDGMEAVWHLQEAGTGAVDEFIDSSPWGNHGTGGDGTAGTCPTREEAIFCLYVQAFDGTNDLISFDPDTIGNNQDFAVSAWVRPDGFFAQRSWFTRGHESNPNKLVFSLGDSVMHHVHAIFAHNNDGTTDEFHAFSSTTLTQDQWYHIGVSWNTTDKRCKIYINGVLDATSESHSTKRLQPLQNEGYAGKINNSKSVEGGMIELRLHPEERDATWWAAEHDNWCDGDFVLVSERETPTVPLI